MIVSNVTLAKMLQFLTLIYGVVSDIKLDIIGIVYLSLVHTLVYTVFYSI